MKVHELKYRLDFLIDEGCISPDDEVILIGLGDKPSGYINNIIMPKFKHNIKRDKKDYYQIGFSG